MASESVQDERARAGGYTVLARRYRSRDFDELIGQEPIARTLQNAIRTERTAHAYLFCGTRGVGKTSMARIFAKALNAGEDTADELTQRVEIGEAILRGEDLDVIEIDGASNRGIDQARDLIAGAGLSPTRCRFKIYIIDEVHMLTKEAFNALLKTMEEPPSHVKFILCTTEPNKVPSTIQSRCQRFDFRAISTVGIAGQLRHILAAEGVEADDDDVVNHVARLGNGSMRDALSLLDRLLSAGEARLTSELLEQMLGIPDHTLVTSLVDAIIEEQPGAALETAAELLARGSTVEQALEMLAEHLRALLVLTACGPESELVELSGEARREAARQAEHFDTAAIVHMIALCDQTARNARSTAAARALFDAVIARLCVSARLADVAALVAGHDPAPAKKKGVEPPGLTSDVRVEVKTDSTRPSVPATVPEPEDDSTLWKRVVEAATPAEQRKLQYLRFQSFDGRVVRLAVTEEGAALSRVLEKQSGTLAELVQRATGRRVRIELDHSACAPVTPAPIVSADERAKVERLPVVRRAMELFDALVVDIEDEGSD